MRLAKAKIFGNCQKCGGDLFEKNLWAETATAVLGTFIGVAVCVVIISYVKHSGVSWHKSAALFLILGIFRMIYSMWKNDPSRVILLKCDACGAEIEFAHKKDT
jgi:uncharacterized membrane protein YfcA